MESKELENELKIVLNGFIKEDENLMKIINQIIALSRNKADAGNNHCCEKEDYILKIVNIVAMNKKTDKFKTYTDGRKTGYILNSIKNLSINKRKKHFAQKRKTITFEEAHMGSVEDQYLQKKLEDYELLNIIATYELPRSEYIFLKEHFKNISYGEKHSKQLECILKKLRKTMDVLKISRKDIL